MRHTVRVLFERIPFRLVSFKRIDLSLIFSHELVDIDAKFDPIDRRYLVTHHRHSRRLPSHLLLERGESGLHLALLSGRV